MQIKYSGNLESDMRLMVRETRRLYQSWYHLGKAISVPLTSLFDKQQFGVLLSQLVALKMRTYKRK
jgi:hypothetical protein